MEYTRVLQAVVLAVSEAFGNRHCPVDPQLGVGKDVALRIRIARLPRTGGD